MISTHQEIIRRLSFPMQPKPTRLEPRLRRLPKIRAVLFDIYGTLLISASGDIVAGRALSSQTAFEQALSAVGFDGTGRVRDGAQLLLDEISRRHDQARQLGVSYPEVDIVDVWRTVLNGLPLVETNRGSVSELSPDATLTEECLQRVAIEYEMRVNPVAPMPQVRTCLDRLKQACLTLGVISNAQFLTIEILRLVLERNEVDSVFDQDLQYYSYRVGQAKPGDTMFRMAAAALAKRGISAGEALYVGNDMLNDIWPASTVGFRTALFAGDARSLRLRNDDARVKELLPDIVVTALSELLDCVG